MVDRNLNPGRSVQTFTIPPLGTHNTVPPFTTVVRRGVQAQLHAITVTGEVQGPTLYVGGGTHGDEINGMEAAWQISREVNYRKLKGSLIIVPIQNPAAFQFRTRLNPFDPIDPDWVHPGDPNGSYTQRIKHILNHLAYKADCVIDLHTAGAGGSNNPMIYVPPEIGNGGGERSLKSALAFGGDRIVYGKREKDYGWPVTFAMPFVAVRDERAGIYSEAGQGGAMVPEDRFVSYFVNGVFNVIFMMGMLEGKIVEQGERLVVDPLSEGVQIVRVPAEGILKPLVKVGDRVEKGQILAEVHIVPEGIEFIRSPQDGLITYLQQFGPTGAGDRVVEVSPSKV
jgi:hypothetical protein